jgi:O-antigen ligase
MPADKNKNSDYQSLTASTQNGDQNRHAQISLKPLGDSQNQSLQKGENSLAPQTLKNSHTQTLTKLQTHKTEQFPSESFSEDINPKKTAQTEIFVLSGKKTEVNFEDLSYAEQTRFRKKQKKEEQDYKLLESDRWLVRNGHTFSYIGLYLFSILVLFRPYELISGLGFLSATAFYFALATLLIYLPTQLAVEGNLTAMSVEVKAILALTLLSLVTMPLAKDIGTSWKTFNEIFSKSVIIFIVMVNVIRTRRRLIGMMWLSLLIGVVLSYFALDMYMSGKATVDGYRVEGAIKGMFENPNEMSLHLVMMIPLGITLALGSKKIVTKILFLGVTLIMLCANFVTFSRGGFLGLLGAAGILAWKLGKRSRVKVTLISAVAVISMFVFAPGNFGVRVLSIFIPGLDEAGSSDQRSKLLKQSIWVTLRNPWGIGIGNFPIVGERNLQTHNVFTQVSSELGIIGLIIYLIFLLSPFRKLGAIERTEFAKENFGWFYYLAVGLQASIMAYMISAFFASVAYNWFAFYLIAYAVVFRRVYQFERGLEEEVKAEPLKNMFGWQTAEKNA